MNLWMVQANHNPLAEDSPAQGHEGDWKFPGVTTCRLDDGTSLDILAAIEFHQTPAAGIGQIPPHGDAMQGHDEQMQVGQELDALLSHPGDRRFIFYRPDPHATLRVQEASYTARAATSLEEVRQFLYRMWPDLPGTQWELHTVDPSWSTSPLAPLDTVPILVWAQNDLLANDGTSTIALVEHQRWDLATGLLKSSLVPLSLWQFSEIPNWIRHIGLEPLCQGSPCAVRQNGRPIGWRRLLRIRDANYMLLYTIENSAQIRRIISPPMSTAAITINAIPPWFGAEVRNVAQIQWPDAVDLVVSAAKAFQVSLSLLARAIYSLTGISKLIKTYLAVATPHAGPVHFHRFQHQASRDPFGLYFDLLDADLITSTTAWSIVPFHDSIALARMSALPEHAGIFTHLARPLRESVLAFIEILWYQSIQRSPAIHHQVRWLPQTWTGLSLPKTLVPIDNIEQCHLRVNGRPTPLTSIQRLRDGAFVHFTCHLWSQENATNKETLTTQDEATGSQPQQDVKRARLAESGTSSFTTTTYTGAPVGLDLAITTFWWLAMLCWTSIRFWVRQISLQAWSLPSRRYQKPWAQSFLSLGIIAALLITPALGLHLPRIGEAKNPGPEMWFGSTNPSGVRGKEFTYDWLPVGIWGVSESQLTMMGQRQVRQALRRPGATTTKSYSTLFGHPVEPRARSIEAGTWSGVMMLGAGTFRPVNIQWPGGEFELGRAQLAEAWVGPFSVMIANVYGWAKSPTWPRAHAMTSQLLDVLTKELVLSRGGPRMIMGDLNIQDGDTSHFEVWRSQGWFEAQEWAAKVLGRPISATSKDTNRLDYVWMSPEMTALIQDVQPWDYFADHSALGVKLSLPLQPQLQYMWHLPAYIPWQQLDFAAWQDVATPQLDMAGPPTKTFDAFCRHYEQSFDGYITTPSTGLPTNCYGRGRTLAPQPRRATYPLLRPSRPGEATQPTELLGRNVQHWFRQLRRLQSLLHGVRAGKETPEATAYRVELWHSIKNAPGFANGFTAWWPERPVQLQGTPAELPQGVPATGAMERLFHDFQVNYKKFEAWHVRQRRELLQVTFQTQQTKIFSMVKPEGKSPLTQLEDKKVVHVLAQSDDATMVQVSEPLTVSPPFAIRQDDFEIEVQDIQEDIIQTDADTLFTPGTELEVIQRFVTTPKIHEALAKYWSVRWWKDPLPPETWDRIFAFARNYMPRGQLEVNPIDIDSWTHINKRYTQKAARGPDGFSAKDLQWMPTSLKQQLVDQLNHWEQVGSWPQQLLTGFVFPLPKRAQSYGVGDYRPVIIYSAIYRSWSSLRARGFLKFIGQLADTHQFGFLPGCEAAEIWLLLQGMIELSHQELSTKVGFVTDLVKAFESLPREPIRILGEWLGLPSSVLELWHDFLANMHRRFRIGDTVGPPLFSNVGYPEGCALSCVAMAIVDLSFHMYFAAYCPTTIPLSFVDNLELIDTTVASLGNGIVTLRCWTDMWHLELDLGKTYTWGTTPSSRADLAALQWPVKESAKDLGAQISYGKKLTVAEQQNRLETLTQYWYLLTRTYAPDYNKYQILFQALWPRAFHGVSVCTLGQQHLRHLRSQAAKALHYNHGGSNPGIRLALLSPSLLCDPGYYQCWMVILTFKRILTKQPALLNMWSSFMNRWRGERTQGPFGKLLEVSRLLGWQLNPPWIQDHDGVSWHIMDTHTHHLELVLKDAWAQRLAADVANRKDYAGLQGIDYDILRRAQGRLLPSDRKWLSMLRDGTFVEPLQQKKFDMSKDCKCPLCGAIDSIHHRVFVCPRLASVRTDWSDLVEDRENMPVSLATRLLPSRNPFLGHYRFGMAQLKDVINQLPYLDGSNELHLFTDGSCLYPKLPLYARTSFAVVDATTDRCILRGLCGGQVQSSDLAELRAIIYAVEWASQGTRAVTIWSDNAYAASGFQGLLLAPHNVPDDSYSEDWCRLQHAILSCSGSISIQHVASHQQAAPNYISVQEWSAYWNDRADHETRIAHLLLPAELRQHWENAVNYYETELRRLLRLQDLYLCVVRARNQILKQVEDIDQEIENDYVDPPVDAIALRRCEADWQSSLQEVPVQLVTSLCDQFGAPFTKAMLNWLQELPSSPNPVGVHYTFLEIAFHWGLSRADLLPRPDPLRPKRWRSSTTLHGPPTLAAVLRLVKHFFAAISVLTPPKSEGISLLGCGVFTPQSGISLVVGTEMARHVWQSLVTFTSRRPIRKANDLSRPIS